MEYICPADIAALYNDPETIGYGRGRFMAWADTIALEYGDRLWEPENGWWEKLEPSRNN